MVNDVQNTTVPRPDESPETQFAPATLPDPNAVDDSDEEDGRL